MIADLPATPALGLWPKASAQRVLTVATFVNSFGGGMLTTTSVLYFTRIVGLSEGEVATGLFCGAMVGLGSGIVAGRVADRLGPKRTHVTIMTFGGVVIAGFTVVDSFGPFIAVSLLAGAVIPADEASKAPLVRALGGAHPTAFIGYLRSVTNLALALGAVAGGVAIQIDSRPAYVTVVVCRTLAYLGCALVLLRLPFIVSERAPGTVRNWAVLHDRAYLSATLVNTVMSVHYAVLSFLLPLWIVGNTHAPRWVVSAVYILNTFIVVVLQTRVSRGVDDPRKAGQRMAWAGMAFLLGLALMAFASGPSVWPAVGLLATGTVLYTLGELWHAAASTEYCFGLAPAHMQGQYAGMFGLGGGVADAAAPALMGALPLAFGAPGWLLVGAVLLLAGLGCGPLVSRAGRR